MKKTLLAAALLAGFAGVAQAATSVTLYGIIDTGLGYNKVSGGSVDKGNAAKNGDRFGMINGVQSGSRWGMRGTEDLGDGLRAMFQLESGFNSGNGSMAQGNRLFGRQATVSLANDSWGQLDFGRQTNIASKYFSSIDPFNSGFGQANIGVGLSAANTQRYDNMIMYQTPVLSGFQFGAGYSFNADDVTSPSSFRTTDNTRAVTTGLSYVNGPLNVALAYDQLSGKSGINAKPRQYSLGIAYDFEVVKLSAAYARTNNGWFTGQSVTTASGNLGTGSLVFADGSAVNSYMLGLTVPVDASSRFFGSWQMLTQLSDQYKPKDVSNKMNVYSLGYTYDLSKRTNLYAYGSYGKNYAFSDLNSSAVGVGVRHRF